MRIEREDKVEQAALALCTLPHEPQKERHGRSIARLGKMLHEPLVSRQRHACPLAVDAIGLDAAAIT